MLECTILQDGGSLLTKLCVQFWPKWQGWVVSGLGPFQIVQGSICVQFGLESNVGVEPVVKKLNLVLIFYCVAELYKVF